MDSSQLLDDDILEKIVRHHLPKFSDRLRFSLVCKSWNSLANRSCRRQLLPGLLSRLPDKKAGIYQFLSLSMMVDVVRETGTKPLDSVTSNPARRRPMEMLPCVKLPMIGYPESHVMACLDGWLLIAEPRPISGRRYLQLQLLNPITSATIALPRPTLAKLLSSMDDIIKAVISSSPDNIHVDCHVIVLLKSSPYLAWCKVLGEGCGWKFLSNNKIFGTQPDDVCYCGETLYVRNGRNVYIVRDLIVASSHRKYSVRVVSMPLLSSNHYDMAPDLAGQLVIYSRKSIYKLVVSSSSSSSTSDYEWEKLKSLDGYAVFSSRTHQSFCLPASDDHNNGVVENRIYSPCQVINLDDGCFSWLANAYNGVIVNCSFWFLPMPRDVIGEHIRSEEGVSMSNSKYKAFSYWTDSKVFEDSRFRALLSSEDDE